MEAVIRGQPKRATGTLIRSPSLAIVVGALLGLALTLLADPPDPAQTITALAAAGGFLAAIWLGPRATRRDWYPVQLMLSLNLGVFAVTERRTLGTPVTVLIGASAVLLALVAVMQRFGK